MTRTERFNLARVIANALDRSAWAVDDEAGACCRLRPPDGRALYIDSRSGIAARGRLTVHGAWPLDDRGQVMLPSNRIAHVTFAEDRPADAIANVVARKYLPAYTAAFDACRRRVDEANAYRASTNATAHVVTELLGTTLRGSNSLDVYNTDLVYGDVAGYSVNAQIAGDRVALEIRGLSVDDVRSVIDALRGTSFPAEVIEVLHREGFERVDGRWQVMQSR